MAVPSQTEMYEIVLKLYGRSEPLSRREVKDLIPTALKLGEDELRETTSSGAPVYGARTVSSTSSFSDGALEFAQSYPHATIALIDGNRLANLMIRYDVGVSTERTVKIKRFDTDYFNDKG